MPKRRRSHPDDPASLNLSRIVYELLMNPSGRRVRELMKLLKIKDRTYRKYIQTLGQHFMPFMDSEGRSLLDHEGRGDQRILRLRGDLPRQEDTYGEVVALHFAQQLFKFVKDTTLWPAIESVFKEFRTRPGIKGKYPHVFRNSDRLFHYQPFAPKDYSKHGEILRQVIRALIDHRRVRMFYRKSKEAERREFLVEPLSLVLYLGALYLIAQRTGEAKRGQFLVDRIEEIHLEPESFQYPSDREYTPAMFYGDSFGGFVEREQKLHEVQLKFADKPWLKQYLRERTWHSSQRFKDLPDGRLEMRMKASGSEALARWIRMFGDDVELVAPKDLLKRRPSHLERGADGTPGPSLPE